MSHKCQSNGSPMIITCLFNILVVNKNDILITFLRTTHWENTNTVLYSCMFICLCIHSCSIHILRFIIFLLWSDESVFYDYFKVLLFFCLTLSHCLGVESKFEMFNYLIYLAEEKDNCLSYLNHYKSNSSRARGGYSQRDRTSSNLGLVLGDIKNARLVLS